MALVGCGGMVAMPLPRRQLPVAGFPECLSPRPARNRLESGDHARTTKYATISAAVAASRPGRAVCVACPGAYTEDVIITRPLTLVGESAHDHRDRLPGAPTGAIGGQAPFNGITIESSHVTVRDSRCTAREGEGILAVNPDPYRSPRTQLFR